MASIKAKLDLTNYVLLINNPIRRTTVQNLLTAHSDPHNS